MFSTNIHLGDYLYTALFVEGKEPWVLFTSCTNYSTLTLFLYRMHAFSLADTKLINSLPNNKVLDWSKWKAMADDKIKVLKMMIFVFDRVVNIVGNGENSIF